MNLNIGGDSIQHREVISSVAMAERVKRYHTFPVLCEQTVAAHTWRVAMIYIQLFGLPRAEVLEYVLKHDIGELGSGDVPFYAKRRNPAPKEAMNIAENTGLANLGMVLPKLTEEEWTQFKVADLLEMFEFGQIELHMGNQYGDVVSRNIMEALLALIGPEKTVCYHNKLWPGKVT